MTMIVNSSLRFETINALLGSISFCEVRRFGTSPIETDRGVRLR